MKIKIILLVWISFSCFGKSFGQKNNPIEKDQKAVVIQNQNILLDNEIKKPKTKRQAVVAIKVLNRHNGKFHYNNSVISYREALKLVRKEFDDLMIIEYRKVETISITDKES